MPALNTLQIRKAAPLSDKIAQLTRAENNFSALKRLDLTDNILGKADLVALLQLISRPRSRITTLPRDITDSGTENKHREIDYQLALNGGLALQRSRFHLFNNLLTSRKRPEQEDSAPREVQIIEPELTSSTSSAMSLGGVDSAIDIHEQEPTHEPVTFIEATYYHLVSQNVRELTFCFGKATVNGLEVDYDQLFKDQVNYFIGDENNFPNNAGKPKRLAYYVKLKEQLETLLSSSETASSGILTLASGPISFGVNALSSMVTKAFLPAGMVAAPITAATEQAEQYWFQIAYQRRAALWILIKKTKKAEKILDRMAFLITLRYLNDFREHVLSQDQAVTDAQRIMDFIANVHVSVDPMIKTIAFQQPSIGSVVEKVDDPAACVLYKLDCLMETLFGSPESVLGLTTQQKKVYKTLTNRSVWVTKTPALIPLPLYASEARFYFDQEIKPEFSTLARRFRQAILHATNHYQKSYRHLGIFERAFIQFFTNHGGDHSISQCKTLEDMVKEEEFKTLVTNFIVFLTKNKNHSGLRKDSLHTYLTQVFEYITESEPLWQSTMAAAALTLTSAPAINHAGAQDPPCTTSEKGVTWLSTIIDTVDATKNQVENLLYQERQVIITELEKMTEDLNHLRVTV